MFPFGLPLVFKQAKSIYSSLTDLMFSFRFRNNSHLQIHLALYQIPLKPATRWLFRTARSSESSGTYIISKTRGQQDSTDCKHSMHTPADIGTSQPQATEKGKLPVPVLPQLQCLYAHRKDLWCSRTGLLKPF